MARRRHSGALRWLVTIRKPNTTDDAANYPGTDWTGDSGVIARNVPAEWIEVSGGERVRGVQVLATANVMLMLRYRKDVDPIHAPAVTTYRFYRQDVTTAYLEVLAVTDPYGTQEWLAVQGVRKVR